MMFIKKYWLVILGTLVVGLFTALPSLVFFQRIGDNFKGVYPVFNGDALYYQTRVQEIADGHGELNHPYFFEHKDAPYPQASGAEYFVYGLTRLFGTSAPALQVSFDFIAPALIFLLTYLLLKRFSANEYTAVLFPALLYTVVMAGLFKPVNPQITFPLLLLFLIFWARLVLLTEKKWLNSIITGLVWGLLFLTYFYHWSFLVVVVGIYLIILLLSKSWSELKYHGLTVGIAGLIGIPYFLRIFASLNAPWHAETAVRVGQYFSHLPESYPRLLVALVWLAFFIWFAKRYKLEHEKKAQIVATLLIANVLYPNHQVITGLIIENAVHWSWMPIVIFGIGVHYMIGVLWQENMKLWKNRWLLLAIFLLWALPAWRLSTFLLPTYKYQYKNNVALNHQYYVDAFAWIEANAPKDAVILADAQLMKFIPVYTAANVYNTNYAYNLPASNTEVVERALLSHFFESDFFTKQEFGLSGGARLLWSFPYESEKNTHNVAGIWTIPYEPQYGLAKEKEFVSAVYDNLLKQGWNISLLKAYRLDYIIWDKVEHPEWNIEKYKELELLKQLGNLFIYRFKS